MYNGPARWLVRFGPFGDKVCVDAEIAFLIFSFSFEENAEALFLTSFFLVV